MTPFEEAFYAPLKPMLASDWNPKKLSFPKWVQPKIDGVRALHLRKGFTGRSLNPHANKFNTAFFNHGLTLGLDGEMAAWSETAPDLCRRTTSALNTVEGEPFCLWWLFDLITIENWQKSYCERYEDLNLRIQKLRVFAPELWSRTRLVPYRLAYTLEDIRIIDAEYVEAGYEGSILRDPYGSYKSGRSTPTEGALLRIKAFAEEEFRITALVEGNMNDNEATINELGHTERSTHAENMIPNGRVGALDGIDLKTEKPIRVGAGCMTHAERIHYWAHPDEIVGKVGKYKKFLHGEKDKPRFPTFQSLKAESDM